MLQNVVLTVTGFLNKIFLPAKMKAALENVKSRGTVDKVCSFVRQYLRIS